MEKKLVKHKTKGGLGFRDLERFNRALIAKDMWRLNRQPDSLVRCVFRVSYFADGDLFRARCGSNGSSMQRSLVWGDEIVYEGSR